MQFPALKNEKYLYLLKIDTFLFKLFDHLFFIFYISIFIGILFVFTSPDMYIFGLSSRKLAHITLRYLI